MKAMLIDLHLPYSLISYRISTIRIQLPQFFSLNLFSLSRGP